MMGPHASPKCDLLMLQRLFIERLGHRGEGVAHAPHGPVFVPYALPGDTVRAEIDGEDARLIDIEAPSPDRIAPFCGYFGRCGGCAVQALAGDPYAAWKRGLVANALRNAGLDVAVEPTIDAHGAGRRRVVFHARIENGAVRVGFMRARSHEIVAIDACPLLEPRLFRAPAVAKALAEALASHGKPLDIIVTATQNGLDVDLRGAGALAEAETRALAELGDALDLARLSNHGRLVVQRRDPSILVGATAVVPPPGAFLQATAAGEQRLAALVERAIPPGARRVADLFCGLGAFALRLAPRAGVLAIDGDASAIAALARAANASTALRPIETATRDLFRRPLAGEELRLFDAVVFDPPRAGAKAQAEALARSETPVVVAVSCNPQTFARDAGILIEGGYRAIVVTPVDQFRGSPHVEIVAAFERQAKRPKLRRGLLSR